MVFTSNLDLDTRCLGIIGSSSRFCIATQVAGKTDCGIKIHSKEKFCPKAGHVYPPGGTASGRPTARFDADIIVSRLSADQAQAFREMTFSPRAGTHAIIDAATAIPATLLKDTMAEYNRAAAEIVVDKAEPKVKQEDWANYSVLGASEFERSLFEEEWEEEDESGGEDKSWGPTTRLHSKLKALQELVEVVGTGVPRVISKLDGNVIDGIQSAKAEIDSLKQDKEDLHTVLGDSEGVVSDQGDLAGTVAWLLSNSIGYKGEIDQSKVRINELFDAVFEANSTVEQHTKRLLQVITKISQNCSTKIALMEERAKALEKARFRIDTYQPVSTAGVINEPSNGDVMDAILNGEDPWRQRSTQSPYLVTMDGASYLRSMLLQDVAQWTAILCSAVLRWVEIKLI